MRSSMTVITARDSFHIIREAMSVHLESCRRNKETDHVTSVWLGLMNSVASYIQESESKLEHKEHAFLQELERLRTKVAELEEIKKSQQQTISSMDDFIGKQREEIKESQKLIEDLRSYKDIPVI